MVDARRKTQRVMFLNRGPTYVEGSDISDILQNELTDYRPITVPPGYYENHENLTTPFRSGGYLSGAGRTDVLIKEASTLSGNSTRIRCLGNALTGNALTIQGSEFDLRNITWLGATSNPPTGPDPPDQAAGIGIAITSEPHVAGGGGLGPGKHNIFGVGLYGWTTALKSGEAENDYNCDHCHFERITFRNNTNCIWIGNSQGMGHTFSECQFRHENTYCCRVSGGGHHRFNDCLCTHAQTFFYFDGTNNNSGSPPYELFRTGNDNRIFSNYNLKVDSQHAGGFKFIETTNVNYADVTFYHPQVSGSDAWSMGTIDDGMYFTIEGNAGFTTEPSPVVVSAWPASSA